jgi:hypothetical protein
MLGILRGARAVLVVALRLGMAVSACAQAHQPTPQDALYQQALQWLDQGQDDRARNALLLLLELQPEHAGAWLDLALLDCHAGRAAQAESLFGLVESRFQPPPALLDVISQLRARGCEAEASRMGTRWRLGRGHDSNANQGASNLNFSMGSGSSAVALVLAPDYAPKSDTFTAFSAEFSHTLLSGGSLGFGQVQARQYDALSSLNVASVLLGFEQPGQFGPWALRGVGTLGLTTLGGAVYQRQAQLQLQATAPWVLPTGWVLGGQASWTDVVYPGLRGFDSQVWETRGVLTYKADPVLAQASVGLALDRGSEQRPGNDRSGVLASVQGRLPLGHVWGKALVGELACTFQSWQASSAYSPGLIDERRRQETWQLRAALSLPVARHQALHLELRSVHNRENISLFEFKGQQLQLSWEWLGPW